MNDSNKSSSSSSSYIAHMRATTQSGRGTSTYDRAKAVSELTQLKKVVESLDKNGIVFAAVVPVVERLQTQILAMDMKSQAASGTGSQMQVDEGDWVQVSASSSSNGNPSLFPLRIARLGTLESAEESVFLYIHCYLLRLGFVCAVEIPSSVPGFAATIRGATTDCSCCLSDK
jgi:hypothetical protein